MAPHSSTLARKIPWTEEPGRLQSMGTLESETTERLHFHFSLSCIGEGNGNPLQCSCLENPRDRGTWWAAVSGVAQSQTRLKRLSSSSSRCRRHTCQADKKLMNPNLQLEVLITRSVQSLICSVVTLPCSFKQLIKQKDIDLNTYFVDNYKNLIENQ